MAYVHDTCLRRIDLQIEPILPDGYGVLKALRVVLDVLADAYQLQRDLRKRYPTSLQ
jgi:hypothetical protein